MRSVMRRSRRRGRLAFGFALALLLTDLGTGAAASKLFASFLAIIGARAEATRDKTRDVFDGRLDMLYRKVVVLANELAVSPPWIPRSPTIRSTDPFWVGVITDFVRLDGVGRELPRRLSVSPTSPKSSIASHSMAIWMQRRRRCNVFFRFVTGWLSSRSKTRSHIELLATLHRVDVPEEIPRACPIVFVDDLNDEGGLAAPFVLVVAVLAFVLGRSSEFGRIVRGGPGVGAHNSARLEHDPRHFGRQVRSSFPPSPETAGTGRPARRHLNRASFPSAFRSGATWLSCSSGTASEHHDADKRRSLPSAASYSAQARGN
ncbi:hypothetical protein EDB92DRAFT_1948749 [Lactarius akahatsu]|uniref:Uncharacterized protein n=1 Tax=Lactarius akahatsu TaxID=416441 RepID=A0AAD4Q606_9AGAM|nr:hypothetical protein EDB92DRAFT_1948749 [Lactarius akahatsu]